MNRPCPQNAGLNIAGEYFPCDTMDQMSVDSETHDGWAHSSKAANATWSCGVVHSDERV
jgi:hypothetical protein